MIRRAGTVVVAALLTAGAAPLAASALEAPALPPPPPIESPLPAVPIPDVPPVLPADPPPVPKVEVPELPAPAPAPTPAAEPPATPDPGRGAPGSTATEPGGTAGAPSNASPPTTAGSSTGAGRQRRAADRRPAARGAAGRERTRREPDRARVAVAQPLEPGDTAARGATGQRGPVSGLAEDVVELVRALPAALLWALLGIGALALGLAVNAFWQSRQRAALEAQRAVLLDDIGLLSSALLPPVPEVLDGIAVSAAYRPADGPAAGGDFYDVFRLDEHRLGVLLGDVSGHGRDSVTQAALARYTLRTLLAAGHPPGETLARADRLLVRDLRPHFVTVIAAEYDARTAELRYAKAGHAPPIVLGTSHDADAESPACPLGLGLGDEWPEFSLRLTDGASVCLYTDGLEDARRNGTRLGRENVERLLAARETPDAAHLLGDLADVADRIADDTAAVVLRHRR